MSGSVSLPIALLSSAERVDVRRFCGYPAYGDGAAGLQSWRFFQAFGTLEYRLGHLTADEILIVRQYLTSLYSLESAVVSASGNLDTDKAAVWTHNRSEVTDRVRLLDEWRRRLALFLGVPLDPVSRQQSSIVI